MNGARRIVGGAMTWWFRLVVLSALAFAVLDAPPWVEIGTPFACVGLAFVRPGRAPRQPAEVAPPVEGRWVALNSPATKVPSHGIRAYGQDHAIDILHPRPPGEPARIGWRDGVHRPDRFPTYGAPVRAMADGTVGGVAHRQRDHRSRGSWPALAYMLLVEGAVRELGGARFVLGNHLVVDHGNGVYAVYAHLRRGSVHCRRGDVVRAGQEIAEVGSSGNASEPHLHVQLMDRPRPTAAAGIPFRWSGIEMVPGEVDMSYQRRASLPVVSAGLPANGQVFTAHPA
jgi:hypothetical protein